MIRKVKIALIGNKGIALSWLMVFCVLSASANWKVNVHLCGSYVVSYGLFSDAEGCGMTTPEASCDYSSNSTNVGQTCCVNKDLLIKNNQQVRKEFRSLEFKSFQELQQNNGDEDLKQLSQVEKSFSLWTDPPWKKRDLLHLIEVYII